MDNRAVYSSVREKLEVNMGSQKRYYWLKLQDGFFNSKRIKKLRKLAGGDTYTIIYLKMQLLAMKTDGILRWTGLEDDFASELALDLDEAPDNVAVTLQYLLSCGLAETDDNVAFCLPWAVENTGSEGSSAKRNREYRLRKASQCDTGVTPPRRLRDGEIEIEKDIEIEKEVKKRKRFTPPTLEEVQAYVKERNSPVNADEFFEYYKTGHWKDSEGKPVQSWKQKLLTWEKHEPAKKKTPYNASCDKAPDVDMDKLNAFLESMGGGV